LCATAALAIDGSNAAPASPPPSPRRCRRRGLEIGSKSFDMITFYQLVRRAQAFVSSHRFVYQ
jgi:hypothetical protein